MKANVQVTGPYMLNFATGKMELMEKAGQLKRGQKVYAFGGGMCKQVFAVVNPDTRELVEVGKPEDVEAWNLDNYFSPLTKYDAYIRPISKKFGIGFYYAENEPLYSEEVSKAEEAKVIEDYPILADGENHDKMDILDAYGLKDKAENCLRWFSVASVKRVRLMDKDLTVKTENTVKTEQPTAKAEGLQVVDYSEKAVAVVGDTKQHAEKLKELGGRFNARLKCGAGWIFSKKKEAAVRAAFGL